MDILEDTIRKLIFGTERGLIQSSNMSPEDARKEVNYRESKRYYAFLIQNMKRVYTDKIATAGVMVSDQVNLFINKDFFETLTFKQRVEVLEHECKHVVHSHMVRAENEGIKDPYLWNLACDAAINEDLTSLHEMGVTQDKLKQVISDLKKNESAEYYYKKLKEKQKELKEEFKDAMKEVGADETVDDHDKWKEGEEQNSEISKEKIKKILKEAKDQAVKHKSSVPMEIEEALQRLSKSSTNWKQQLRKFFAKAGKSERESTRKKRNRRYGIMNPGKRKKPQLHIAVALDESGSVGNDEFVQFFAEIDRIVDHGAQVTMIHADAEVNSVYKYEKGMEIKRTGMGGTLYAPALKYAENMEIDGLIYFGDGDCWENKESVKKPSYPVLWALVRNANKPFNFGSTCKIEVNLNEKV